MAQDDLGASDEYTRQHEEEEEEIRRMQRSAAEALERARADGEAPPAIWRWEGAQHQAGGATGRVVVRLHRRLRCCC